jgi:membrane associated rhomboid family serine protease
MVPIQTQVVFLRYPWVNFVWIGLCVLGLVVFNWMGAGFGLAEWLVLDGCFWWFLFRAGTFQLPGYVLIVAWFLLDILGAMGGGNEMIAYWAHIGGFLYGLAAGALLVGSGAVRLESYDNPDLLRLLGGSNASG